MHETNDCILGLTVLVEGNCDFYKVLVKAFLKILKDKEEHIEKLTYNNEW